MNAVVRASVTAAAAILGPSSTAPGISRPGHGHPRREPPARRFAGARIDDVVPLAHAGSPERGLAHREAGEHA